MHKPGVPASDQNSASYRTMSLPCPNLKIALNYSEKKVLAQRTETPFLGRNHLPLKDFFFPHPRIEKPYIDLAFVPNSSLLRN